MHTALFLEPEDGDGPNPGDAEPGIGGGEGGDDPPEWRDTPLAAIDRILARRCRNCAATHPTYRCPELGAALLDRRLVYDTLELVRLWHISRALLVAKLAQLDRAQLLTQAVAFAAWLEAETTAGLPAANVLHTWEEMIRGGTGSRAPSLRAVA